MIIEADGGSRGNPGPAGYGAVVFDADHATVLAERKQAIGVATNNVAEYRGLIAGLAAAAELGAHEVDVRMDSKLVVEQMSGRWKIKHQAMIPLAAQARELAAGFSRVEYTWIPRNRNAHADSLANAAMDDAAGIARPQSAATEPTTSPAAPSQQAATQQAVSSPGAQRAVTTQQAGGSGVGLVAHGGGAHSWVGAAGRPTRVLLLRHGQTELSVQRRYSGRGNPPLTGLGREQARRAAKRLAGIEDIAAIVSSPLTRAEVTADVVGSGVGVAVTLSDGLIETDFGAWEGLTFAEAADRDPQLHASWLGDTSVAAPGGESFDEVRARVGDTLRTLLAAHAGRTLLVVSHVTPIKTILQLALDVGPTLLYRLHLDLASLSIAEFYPDGNASVRLANDTSHLT